LSATVVQPVTEVATALPVGDRRRYFWQRLTPQAVDAVFAGAWLVALEIEALTSSHRTGPIAANVAAVAAMAAAGVIRRRAPFVFLAVVGALTLALSGGLASPARASLVGAYALFVGGYTIAAYQPRRRALAGLVVVLVGVVVGTAVQDAAAGAAFGGGLMVCLVWLLARMVRQQREVTAALEDATARLAAEREERALIALYDERARIARDLHTLVARLVTTMVVQSEAADELVATHVAGADSAIRTIEQTGRQALSQMRHMLGVLRNEDRAGPVHPRAVATALPARAAILDAVSS
jgi:signal transduction histidine kinase